MTPEQRERKNAADKARRLRLKAAKPAAIEAGGLIAPTAPTTAAEVLEAKIAAQAPPKARKPKAVPAPAPTVRMRVMSFKGTDAHHRAFMAAGGGAWLRGVLDAGVTAGHIRVKNK